MGFDSGAGVADSGIGADIDNGIKTITTPPYPLKEGEVGLLYILYIHGGGVYAGEGKEFGRGVGDIGSGKTKGAADAVTVNDHPRNGIRIAKEAVGILYPSLFDKVTDT